MTPASILARANLLARVHAERAVRAEKEWANWRLGKGSFSRYLEQSNKASRAFARHSRLLGKALLRQPMGRPVPRVCDICEKQIGDAPAVHCSEVSFHEWCLRGARSCSICSEQFLIGENIADPASEPFRLLDFDNLLAHLDCCREAAWNAEMGQRTAAREYDRATGRLEGNHENL